MYLTPDDMELSVLRESSITEASPVELTDTDLMTLVAHNCTVLHQFPRNVNEVWHQNSYDLLRVPLLTCNLLAFGSCALAALSVVTPTMTAEMLPSAKASCVPSFTAIDVQWLVSHRRLPSLSTHKSSFKS